MKGHLLVLDRGDLLQEAGRIFSGWQLEAHHVEEVHNLFSGPMVHSVTCTWQPVRFELPVQQMQA